MRFLAQTPIVGAALLVCALVFGHPAAAASDAELCPVADKRQNRSVSYRNNTVSAPATAQETAALMAALQSGAGKSRTIAIKRLALAGDLPAFRALLANADVDGVYIYATYYLNRDGTVCIDPELERALVDRLFEPQLGHRLMALLGKNTYRDKRTLHALRQVPFDGTDARKANQYLAFARAMTATHLPNVEAEVLAHARSLLPLETPIEKSTLAGLHQHYVKFFTDRGYARAVAYFRELLAQADREEPVQSFQIKYGMLRTVVQRGLAALEGAGGSEAIAGELEAIASKPLDPFAMSEIQNITRLAPSLTDPNARNAVVSALARLLNTAQPARYEYPLRRTAYRTLAALDSAESKALLVAELGRYTSDAPPPVRAAAMPLLFEALNNVTDLDIAPLAALVDDQWAPPSRRRVWQLAGEHPSDAGVDFLLAELRLALSATAETEKVLGVKASAALLKLLTALPTSEYQRRARDGIDALVDEGMLPDRDYLYASAKLNKALGNESPRYVAFREEQARQKAAQRQAAEAQGRREMQAAFAEELARHRSTEGIAGNIALLATNGGETRRGVQWLIIVGEAALPQLHHALAAPTTTDRQRFQAMKVLGEIGSARSIAPLIQAAKTRSDGGLYRPALFALALLAPTEEAIAFAYAQLADGVGERRRIAGLVYLAQVRHEPATVLVSRFTQDTLPLRTRAAGWYLGARLGVPDVAASVAAALQQTTDRSELEALLHSLAEAATSPEEFARIANSVGFTERSSSYRQSLAYCAFRTAPGKKKTELAYQVLGDGRTWHRREAIRYLLATDPRGTVDKMTGGIGQWLPLHMLLPQSANLRLLFSESRRMGYEMRLTDKGYVLIRV